jgi:hypothetical protein
MIDLRIIIFKIGQLSKTGYRYRKMTGRDGTFSTPPRMACRRPSIFGIRCQNLPIDNGMSLTISQRVQSGGRPVGVLSMRNILLLCLGLLAAYWIDQTYFGGAYSRPTIDMLHNIIESYR